MPTSTTTAMPPISTTTPGAAVDPSRGSPASMTPPGGFPVPPQGGGGLSPSQTLAADPNVFNQMTGQLKPTGGN